MKQESLKRYCEGFNVSFEDAIKDFKEEAALLIYPEPDPEPVYNPTAEVKTFKLDAKQGGWEIKVIKAKPKPSIVPPSKHSDEWEKMYWIHNIKIVPLIGGYFDEAAAMKEYQDKFKVSSLECIRDFKAEETFIFFKYEKPDEDGWGS